MASKTDRLKPQAQSTSNRLFRGMEKLNAREIVEERNDSAADDILSNEAMTDRVEIYEDVETPSEVEPSGSEPDISTAPESPKEEPTIFTDDDSLSRRIKEEKSDTMDISEEKPGILEGILKDVGEGKVDTIQADAVKNNASITSAKKKMSAEQSISDDSEIINDKINMTDERQETKPSKKQSSRYEKDKFLLLDIRGYRDYIEHIAKAANMSATKYIRSLIEQDMEKNMEIYLAHKKLEEMLRNKSGN